MRGHGGSDPAPGNYAMEQLVADTVQIFDYSARQGALLWPVDRRDDRASIGDPPSRPPPVADPLRHASESPADAKQRWGPRARFGRKSKPIAEFTMARWLSEGYRGKLNSLAADLRHGRSTPPQGYIGCAAAIQNFKWTPD